MALTLYGKGGRTFRTLWMLHEAQLLFEHKPVDWAQGESHSPEFLNLNPNGKVPVLLDDGLVLFESLAINYHLAKTHAPQLWPADARQQSQAIQWLAWGMGELEGPHDAANRLQTEIESTRLNRSLDALRKTLAGQQYMMGESFSVVNLNTCCLLLRPQYQAVAKHDAALGEWFARCVRRTALAAATAD